MTEQTTWVNDPAVLWREGNWKRVVPRATQTRPELVNAIARLSIVASIVAALALRSFVPLGIGLLGLVASSKMAEKVNPMSPPEQSTPAANVQPRRKRKSKRKKKKAPPAPEYPQFKQGPASWNDMFTGTSDATGAYVSLANQHQQQPSISQTAPSLPDSQAEGQHTENLVPASDIMSFRAGNVLMRSPFPHPASDVSACCATPTSGGASTWALSAPYQTGFPTSQGPQPTAVPPTPGVRPFAAEAASAAVGPQAFQPVPQVAFGAFASDGGATSEMVTPSHPLATQGDNFTTNAYQPRNHAPAGEALQGPPGVCFPPDRENPLGNPGVAQNRVARPPLCPAEDPRSDSQQFLNQLYEAPSQVASGYQFFPFPVQDVVEARDNFQKFVYEDGQTHFKDKYSGENVGVYNITDQVGPLGF